MGRFKSRIEDLQLRGRQADDMWEGPLAVGDWVMVEGAMGHGYGYGQLAEVRPANLMLDGRTVEGVLPRCRRDQIREAVSSQGAARARYLALERLRLSQPYQVFVQHWYRGRYRHLLALAGGPDSGL